MKKTKKNLEKIVSNLCWNVFCYNFNAKTIEKFNVFEHGRFCEDIIKNMLECNTKAEFSEKLRLDAFYYYGSKCEWEVVITSFPPYISKEEIERLSSEDVKYRISTKLEVGEKIDVYQQLRLNWDAFVNYVYVDELLDKKFN